MLKCAYEKIFFSRSKFVASVFTSEAVRRQLGEEIARRARVDPEEVIIDVPSLPSVPYRAIEVEPIEIPLFMKKGGRKIPQRVEDLSRIIGALQVFMNIVRVYTTERLRDKIATHAQSVLEALPSER
jgi:hypothetical protein